MLSASNIGIGGQIEMANGAGSFKTPSSRWLSTFGNMKMLILWPSRKLSTQHWTLLLIFLRGSQFPKLKVIALHDKFCPMMRWMFVHLFWLAAQSEEFRCFYTVIAKAAWRRRSLPVVYLTRWRHETQSLWIAPFKLHWPVWCTSLRYNTQADSISEFKLLHLWNAISTVIYKKVPNFVSRGLAPHHG